MNADLPLRDIHLPDAIGWWPPAPGWWIVAIVVPLLVWLVLRFIIRRHRRLALYRISLKQLQQLETEYQEHNHLPDLVTGLSTLLRQVSMSVDPRHESASLTGEDWLSYLDTIAKKQLFQTDLGQQFLQCNYQPQASCDGERLIASCRQWLLLVSKRGRHA